jgi:hypothetical protein
MQDFSGQPDLAVSLGFVPLLLLAVMFGFLMIGTKATHRPLRRLFKLLAWAVGLALGVGLIGVACIAFRAA